MFASTPARVFGGLTDHVFPRLPVRQWVLAVPKLHHAQEHPQNGTLEVGVAVQKVAQALGNERPQMLLCLHEELARLVEADFHVS